MAIDDHRGTSLSSGSEPHPTIDGTETDAQTQPVNNLDRQKTSRQTCDRCTYPTRTCVCPSLPTNPLSPLFQKCRILVLQHPHELRRANSSLPLVDLCMFGKRQNSDKDAPINENDFVMKTIVGRRFGDHCDGAAMKVLRDPNGVVVLVFPHKLAMDFEEGLRIAEERCCITPCEGTNESEINSMSRGTKSATRMDDPQTKKMTIIFIDATWKHAKEMEAATDAAGEWPASMIRVQMTPTSSGVSSGDANFSKGKANAGENDSESNTQHFNYEIQPSFIQRRFLIRTPPSPDHLSTAECIAWIASRVENNPQIYESVTKVLVYMVRLWKGCSNNIDNRKRSGKSQMTQKKLKLSKG
jgi:DTW domain-containing protein YfiP